MFYKNILFVLTQMWFTIMAGWSGQKMYVEAGTQAYNLLYTGLPVLLLTVFDRDVSRRSALAFPYLYSEGPRGDRLNSQVHTHAMG